MKQTEKQLERLDHSIRTKFFHDKPKVKKYRSSLEEVLENKLKREAKRG